MSCGWISPSDTSIKKESPLSNQARELREVPALRSSKATFFLLRLQTNSQQNVFFLMCDTCHPCECPTLYLSLPRLELLEKRTRLCVKWNLFLKIWRYRAKSRFFVTLHRLTGSENENVLLCLICAYVELANMEVVLLNELIARGKYVCVFSYHVLHTLIRY